MKKTLNNLIKVDTRCVEFFLYCWNEWDFNNTRLYNRHSLYRVIAIAFNDETMFQYQILLENILWFVYGYMYLKELETEAFAFTSLLQSNIDPTSSQLPIFLWNIRSMFNPCSWVFKGGYFFANLSKQLFRLFLFYPNLDPGRGRIYIAQD